MTVATLCKEAALRLTGEQPAAIFGNSEKFASELAVACNEGAVHIAQSHDWERLKTLHTITGDGVTTSFTLPADFDRMPLKIRLVPSWQVGDLPRMDDISDTLDPFQPVNYSWSLAGKTIKLNMAVPNGATVKFFYISNLIYNNKTLALATSDGDAFDLGEGALKLELMWRWRADKRLEYSEDMANAGIALERLSASDGGRRVLESGRGYKIGATVAYPFRIVP